jgi:hypothetical protein
LKLNIIKYQVINGKLGLVYKNGERIIPQGEGQFKDIETTI